MAGRHSGWTHKRLPENAQPYIPAARALLGQVTDYAKRNKLTCWSMRRELPDGTIIAAEVRGGIPRYAIQVAQKDSGVLVAVRSAFVVWARDQDLPDGIDAEFPQQLIRPMDSADGDRTWEVFRYTSDLGGRGDGTYIGRHPDGLKFSGNVDWEGKAKERLSWYGPQTRYWYDGWRQPSLQYGPFVFLLGKVLLDIDDYCTESDVDLEERRVLGAALSGNWLYVMQADLPDVTAVNYYERGGDVFSSPQVPTYTVALRLVRYLLSMTPGVPGAIPNYAVINESHETLWTHSAAGYVGPWHFSPDCDKAATMRMPEHIECHRYVNGAGVKSFIGPSTSSMLAELAITTEGVDLTETPTSLDYTSGIFEALVAVDYDRNGDRIDLYLRFESVDTWVPTDNDFTLAFGNDWANVYLRRGDAVKVPIFVRDASEFQFVTWGHPIAMDLRADAFVMVKHQQLDAEWNFGMSLTIWNKGAVESDVQKGTRNVVNFGPVHYSIWFNMAHHAGSASVSPFYLLLGHCLMGHYGAGFWGVGDDVPRSVYHASGFSGGHLYYLQDAGDGTQNFGGTGRLADTSGTTVVAFSLWGDAAPPAHFNNNREDASGRFNPAALACIDGTLLYSGPGRAIVFADPGDPNTGFQCEHYVTMGSLPTITGVSGTDARFHNAWVLGALPRSIV